MKLISKNSRKILKMSKKEWLEMGRQYKWATSLPDPEQVKQVLKTLTQLSKDLDGLSQNSGYKFLGEKQQVVSLYRGIDRFLDIVQKMKSQQPSSQAAPEIGKTAQKLDVVKTPEKFTDREVTRALRDAIIAEEGAINQYESVVDASDNKLVKKVLEDIKNEERVHVGELQKLLFILLSDEQNLLDEGSDEVKT